MKTIYKYTLELADHQTIEVPADAEFLTAQMQNGKLCVWAIVDTDNLTEKEYFVIVGTGSGMPDRPKILQFLGTVQQAGGALIWHVFRAVK
jgi:hypothetical protein